MKFTNTTTEFWCIMLWYEKESRLTKMVSKMKVCAVIDTQEYQAFLAQNKLDAKHKVNI